MTATPCARNGLVSEDQSWNLLASYQLQHVQSGLCASAVADGPVVLAKCETSDTGISKAQLFWPEKRNYITRIRDTVVSITAGSVNKLLTGTKSGQVAVGSGGDWKTWSYFPNTRQLRNQFTANFGLGYPMCLSTCSSTGPVAWV